MYSNTRHVSSLHISDRYQTHMTVHRTTSTGSSSTWTMELSSTDKQRRQAQSTDANPQYTDAVQVQGGESRHSAGAASQDPRF